MNYSEELHEIQDYTSWESLKLFVTQHLYGLYYGINEANAKKVHEEGNKERCIAYAYWILYHRHNICLDYYCRHYYNVIKYIDVYRNKLMSNLNPESDLYLMEKNEVEEDIKNYLSLAKATLSVTEEVVLFYNMLLFPKSKDLYTKYNIFENLNKENLILEEHADLFEDIKIGSFMRFKNIIGL